MTKLPLNENRELESIYVRANKQDAFKLWCWRRLLRVPRTARSNQSILKEINPEYSLEGLMLKLKLQYFGHLMWRANSLEKTLMLGKTEGRKRRRHKGWDGWMATSTQWTWIWANSGTAVEDREPGVLQSIGLQTVRYNLMTKQQTTTNSWLEESSQECMKNLFTLWS